MLLSFRQLYSFIKNPQNPFGFLFAIFCSSSAWLTHRMLQADLLQSGKRRIRHRLTAFTYTDGIGQTGRASPAPAANHLAGPEYHRDPLPPGSAGPADRRTRSNAPGRKTQNSKPKIGDLLNPNYEVILAAKPDLVIASTAGNDRGAIMKLAGLGLPVYVAAPRTVEKIFQSVEEIGRITDCAERGLQLVAQMKERLEKIKAPYRRASSRPRVFYHLARSAAGAREKHFRKRRPASGGSGFDNRRYSPILSPIQSRTDSRQRSRRHSDRQAGRKSHPGLQKRSPDGAICGRFGEGRFMS